VLFLFCFLFFFSSRSERQRHCGSPVPAPSPPLFFVSLGVVALLVAGNLVGATVSPPSHTHTQCSALR
jgi:hypothetical protein